MTKIYTKTGDRGQTSLLGGRRVMKSDARINSYGTVDELNSWVGLLACQEIPSDAAKALEQVQDRLFTIGSVLASDPGQSKVIVPDLYEEDVRFLELEIDRMNDGLPGLKSFILPGGHTVVSYCHLARCVCRRAERDVVALAGTSHVDETVIRYLNRLSDYLFTLARALLAHYKVSAVEWKPKAKGG